MFCWETAATSSDSEFEFVGTDTEPLDSEDDYEEEDVFAEVDDGARSCEAQEDDWLWTSTGVARNPIPTHSAAVSTVWRPTASRVEVQRHNCGGVVSVPGVAGVAAPDGTGAGVKSVNAGGVPNHD